MEKLTLLTLTLALIAATATGSSIPSMASNLGSFPSFEKHDETKYYCGNCCGWDIYCNKMDNPLKPTKNAQTLASSVPSGPLKGLEVRDPTIDPKYLCFHCCGKYWYCNRK